MNVAFIGTGNMGAPMARNLLRAGHAVAVYNRTRARAEALAAGGARVADSVRQVVQDAGVVVTMLAHDAAVEDVAAGIPAESLHMGMSTISVELARRLGAGNYVSAPVMGRPDAAQARKLWIIAAGANERLDRCRPLMEAMGRGVSVVGNEPWKANMVKLGANFTIASMLETLGESAALMRKAGIPVAQFFEIVNNLFQSPVYANYGGIIAEERYEPAGFAMRLGLKDVKLALAAANGEGVAMPLGSLLHDHFLSAIALGHGDRDWAGVAQFLAESAGLGSS